VDPVGQLRAQPDRLDSVPQPGPELTDLGWLDPVLQLADRRQQLSQDVRVDHVVLFNRAEAIA